MKNLYKNHKGITLIALIITIIVLLILAGVTIAQITGNENAMDKAVEAKQKQEEGAKQEVIEIAKASSKLEPAWDGTVATSFAGGTGEEGNPYIIENGSQLAYLSSQVNNGETFEGKYISITKSINLGGRVFTPIGELGNNNIGSYNGFNGKLVGNNNVITGLNINQPEKSCIGLIGVLGGKGILENIVIYDGKINGYGYVGGIVGYNNGTIRNCQNNVNITSSGNAGGIVGYGYSGSVSNCKNSGVISTTSGNYAGGIVGNMKNGSILDCSNNGIITSYGQSAGGIVGIIENGTITNCNNNGDVSSGKSYTGGIAGIIMNGNISNSYNTGNIESTSERQRGIAGGIIGAQVDGNIRDVYNSGNVRVGNFTSKIDIVGGIIGQLVNGKLTNAYNKGELSLSENPENKDYLGGIVGEKAVGENVGGTVSSSYYYVSQESSIPGIKTGAVSTDETIESRNSFNSLDAFINWLKSNNKYVNEET